MAETCSYRQVQLDKVEKQAEADSQEISKSELPQTVEHGRNGVIGEVVIPTDLTMATNLRGYREWPGEHGIPR